MSIQALLDKQIPRTASLHRETFSALLSQMEEEVRFFSQTLDLSPLETLMTWIMECKGSIVLTGVGKSGLVAKKIAATLTSTGTKAIFLSPTDALHGDIGILGPEDIFIVISKSGETEELLQLIPCIRSKNSKIVAIVSQAKSRLTRVADLSLLLPMQKELCPYDLAPTTSTTLQLIFGDLLSVALMRAKNISLAHYASNHPAGQIGKRSNLKVKDLMLQGERLPIGQPHELLENVLQELSDKKCGCLVILDPQERLLGIFTDGDLRRALQSFGGKAMKMSMEDLMTKNPRSIPLEMMAWEALKKMEEKPDRPITVLPVIDEAHSVKGLIRLHDLIQAGV